MADEYVNDVPYVRHFIADLAPARLRLGAALNGVTPPSGEDFDYCELGCAHGDTLAALAAAHPAARFLGVDLGATHIASAKRLARDGGLENIGFLENDFAKLLDEDVGEFDFIVAHGVLTWVSPPTRQALIDFARAKLKPGGLLYVSYNAMPGWGSVEPLRQLLLSPLGAPSTAIPSGASGANRGDAAVDAETSSLERARRGLEFARALESAGAGYFVKNPSATEMLSTMIGAGLPYVVHEYLHEHWTPMYFARVAWEMSARDLHFAGVLPALLNFKDTAVPESLDGIFARVPDRLTFESLKDFAVNETFRRDLYVKGQVPRSVDATNTYLEATAWRLAANARTSERSVELPHRKVVLEGAIYDALFDALAEGAVALPVLAERPAFAGFERDALRAALRRMVVCEVAIPMQASTLAPTGIPDGVFSVPSVYNQMMLRRLASDTPVVMTSTSAGSAFALSALEGLALRALVESKPGEREAWIKAFVGRSVLRLAEGTRVIDDRAEQERVILAKLEHVRTNLLAQLVELGVLVVG